MVRRSLAVVLMLSAQCVYGQYVLSTRAGTIHFTTGDVSVEGRPVQMARSRFTDLAAGQVLRTGKGRAEILLGPGVFLRLDNNGAIRMLDTRLQSTDVEVLKGTALVEVIQIANGDDVHVTVGATRTGFSRSGLHRFNADARELRVFGGSAAVAIGNRQAGAQRGGIVNLDESLAAARFDPHREAARGVPPAKDGLHQWSARRSYQIYRSNGSASPHTTNWEVTRVSAEPDGTGISSDLDRFYVWNRDFGIQLFMAPRRPGQRTRDRVRQN